MFRQVKDLIAHSRALKCLIGRAPAFDVQPAGLGEWTITSRRGHGDFVHFTAYSYSDLRSPGVPGGEGVSWPTYTTSFTDDCYISVMLLPCSAIEALLLSIAVIAIGIILRASA